MHSERAVSWVTQQYLLVLPFNLVCLVERFRWNSPEMSRCFFPENPYNQSQKTTEHFWSGMIRLRLLRRSTDMMQSGGLPSHPHLWFNVVRASKTPLGVETLLCSATDLQNPCRTNKSFNLVIKEDDGDQRWRWLCLLREKDIKWVFKINCWCHQLQRSGQG